MACKNRLGGRKVDRYGSVQGQVMVCCECSNGHSILQNTGNFLTLVHGVSEFVG